MHQRRAHTLITPSRFIPVGFTALGGFGKSARSFIKSLAANFVRGADRYATYPRTLTRLSAQLSIIIHKYYADAIAVANGTFRLRDARLPDYAPRPVDEDGDE